jgi:hypothetical protein
MQWLAREAPMGPDGSAGLRAAGRGPVPGPQVSAQAFGAPLWSSPFLRSDVSIERPAFHCPRVNNFGNLAMLAAMRRASQPHSQARPGTATITPSRALAAATALRALTRSSAPQQACNRLCSVRLAALVEITLSGELLRHRTAPSFTLTLTLASCCEFRNVACLLELSDGP